MAIEIRMETWLDSNQSFITKQRVAEESNPRFLARTLKNFDGYDVALAFLYCPNYADISCPGDVILATISLIVCNG